MNAMATELENHVPTGKASKTRSKFAVVSERGHNRSAPLSSSERGENATTSIQ